MRRHTLRAIIFFVLAAAAGCLPDQLCDYDQRFDNGVCYEIVPDAPPGTPDGIPGYLSFGATCAGDGDCAAPANYCLVDYGQSYGYCTRMGCAGEATACPPRWECFPILTGDPRSPSICEPPVAP